MMYIFLIRDGWTEEVSGRRRRDSSGFELSLKVGIGTFYPHSTKFPLALVQIQDSRETRQEVLRAKILSEELLMLQAGRQHGRISVEESGPCVKVRVSSPRKECFIA